MAKKKKGKVFIKSHGRKTKPGKASKKKVDGYYRKKRPKGKKRIIDKKPMTSYAVRDEYGRIIDYVRKPKKR